MTRGTAFTGAYGKLRTLYLLEDPWNMASPREQYRFAATNAQLASLKERYSGILELGCGEGHQSQHLKQLTDRLFGIDISGKAVKRARRRNPDVTFAEAGLEQVGDTFSSEKIELICACEILYYAKNLKQILPVLQQRSPRIYVSNFAPRSKHMRENFAGPGWRRLEDITHGETVWECFLWER